MAKSDAVKQKWFEFFSVENIQHLFAVDLRTLALFRMLLAFAMLFSLSVIIPDIDAFLTDDGLVPRRGLMHDGNWFHSSLYYLNGSYWFAATLVAVNVVAGICMFVGYRTRLAVFISWILSISLIGRADVISQGGDLLLPLLLFWAFFLPVGKVFSVDAALRETNHREDAPYASIATVGLLLQVVYVYVFGALLKTGDAWMPDGTAVYYAMHLETFATPLAVWFRQFEGVLYVLTMFVYWIELHAPVFLFFPDTKRWVRSIALFLLVCMHLGFRVFMNIGHFWLVSIASLSTFLSVYFWRWSGRVYYSEKAKGITLYYDEGCLFCLKTCQILREFCLPRSVEITPAQSVPEIGEILERETSWVVLDAEGNKHLHWDAVVFVVGQSVLLKPVAWLLALYGKLGLGKATYDFIGRNRQGIGRFSEMALKPQPPFKAPNKLVNMLLVIPIALGFMWNLREQYGKSQMSPYIPQVAWDASRVMYFAQRWSMFAPVPAYNEVRPFLTARTAGGLEIDLRYAEGGAYAVGGADEFSSYRWRKYINRISFLGKSQRDYYYRNYTRFICKKWNDDHTGEDSIVNVQVRLFKNHTLPDYRRQRSTVDFGTWPCDL